MSSSSSGNYNATKSATGPGGSVNVALVHFKARCERLGFGEEVYMVPLEEEQEEEDVGGILMEEEDNHPPPPSSSSRNKMIPLYTTAASFPWYSTLSSLAMPIKKQATTSLVGTSGAAKTATAAAAASSNTAGIHIRNHEFRYRYAIFRGGDFYRWENAADENYIATSNDEDNETSHNTEENALHHDANNMEIDDGDDGDHNNNNSNNNSNSNNNNSSGRALSACGLDYHVLPLRYLLQGETYIVNDVLGKRKGQKPDIYHKRAINNNNINNNNNPHVYVGVEGSGACRKDEEEAAAAAQATAFSRSNLDASHHSAASTSSSKGRKTVGFAAELPTYNQRRVQSLAAEHASSSANVNSNTTNSRARDNGQPVQLNATDGLVVVSAFLPVVVHRDEQSGVWTADWDYEALLSMQTHLRVTRVGVVKWKGWHGNYNNNSSNTQSTNADQQQQQQQQQPSPSEEYGVPINERHLVEECLRPFHCVPVWIDPLIFGEMYNGFCKGVLWPVLHNVTSVYASHASKDDAADLAAANNSNNNDKEQFSEVCRDDVEQGPIHGGRGREKELWSAYNQVNRKFSEVVVQCFNEGDLVWIHGFHLLILPSYLTRRISMAKIGIFLHTPFPSSEIFRTLWCREDLLRGMLNADQVGFHLFEYARHFLTCCRRLLGLNYGMIPDASGNGGYTLAIDTNGRHVAVTSIHAGIEPPVLHQILKHDTVQREAAMIRARHPGKTIFCSIDRLESLKGIPLKMLAMERFLKRCPEYIGKIVLIQVGLTAWERGDDYIKTRNEVTEQVQRINEMWPGTIQFQETPDWRMRLQQRLSLMKASDVVLVTPIRDGLNLIPLEFTVAHQEALHPSVQQAESGRRRGLVILSEFSSCTRVMRGALHVNPWKISEIAQAFQQALAMTDEERLKRVTCASEFVTRVTTQRWALAVMLDLKGVHKSVNPVQYSGAGLGLGFRLLGMDVGFESLDFKAVAKAYKMSSQRLILFDYGGTITCNENLDNLSRFRMVKTRSHHSEPTEEMIQTIQGLCEDKKNTVFVVSGKERHSLIKTLGHIPNLGLAAEHGMYISWPERSKDDAIPHSSLSSSSSKRQHNHKEKRHWETLVPISDRTWRSLTTSIMEVYASRTHGSYIEETEMKVLWQYRDADLEFGYLQARELEDHLSNVLRSYPVDILHGGVEEGGYVEVRPKGVNKGVFSMKAICHYDKLSPKGADARIDFALVLGDDHCDEPMLSVMRQVGHRAQGGRASDLPMTMRLVDVSVCDPNVSNDAEVFTCTVGKKPSAASNYLQDVTEVEELLQALVKVSKNPNASKSMLDLMMMQAQQAAAPEIGGGFMGPSTTETTVAGSLGEFLGGIEHDDAVEDDMFF
jgi:trehalose 6-phosphate synthase/phosphatase